MGAGHNRLILYTHDGAAWVRAAGTWDPMPWHVDRAYRVAGRAAQHAFWGEGERSARRACSTSSPSAPHERRVTAVVIGAGPNGLAAAIRLAEAGPTGHRARGRPTRPAARSGPRSSRSPASATTRSPRSTRPAPLRRCSRGCRSSATACAGSHPEACYAHPLPGRPRGGAVPRLERTGGEPRRHALRRRRSLARVRRADARRVRGGPRDDARRVPADRRRAARCSRDARAARRGAVRSAVAGLGASARAPAVRRRRLARLAVRLGRPRRRPTDGRGQRDRRRRI